MSNPSLVSTLSCLWLIATALDLLGATQQSPYASEVTRRGRRVYEEHCLACHRNNGKAFLKSMNLSDDVWNHGSEPDQIKRVIRDGVPQTPMPSFAAKLNGGEIDAVARYVSSFAAGGDMSNETSAKTIHLPKGFTSTVFASNLQGPRLLAFSPSQDLFVSVPWEGKVIVLPDRDRDGVADSVHTFVDGLDRPHGITFFDNHLYVAEVRRIWRFNYKAGMLQAEEREVVVDDLPPEGSHFTRTIRIDPEQRALYVSVGSASCDICSQDPPHSTLTRYNLDGTGKEVFATGLRNTVSFVFHPTTGDIWGTDMGRQGLGDDTPPDEVNLIQRGHDYGFPFAYGQRIPVPEDLKDKEHRAKRSVPPIIELPAHSSPIGLALYTGKAFPEQYRGNLFVCLHGSLPRELFGSAAPERGPIGYKVVRFELNGGKPGPMVDFATGFLVGERAWGRPVDVTVGPDECLYVSDDEANCVYRICYQD